MILDAPSSINFNSISYHTNTRFFMLETPVLTTTRLLGASAHQLQPIAFGLRLSKASTTISTKGVSVGTYYRDIHSRPPSLKAYSPTENSRDRFHSERCSGQSKPTSRRFSFTAKVPREYFPEASTQRIRYSPPAWDHPIYTEAQMKDVIIAHRDTKNLSDRMALLAVRLLRWGLDFATGYKHDKEVAKAVKAANEGKPKPFAMTARKYLVRNVFLESVAGVPGMVGGMLRHMHSMRRLKRDNGWIETLLEESYNERMHLLTFLRMYEPSWFMRTMVLGAQGVFFNGFFLAYLISPRTAHRFVGYLEEEAVITYTREISDIDAGKLPEWENLDAPDIAIKYWNMPEGHRKMRDLLLYIRADEAKHREVNHTLGSLDQQNDPNPYVSEYKDVHRPHPTKGLEHLKPTGWNREEVI